MRAALALILVAGLAGCSLHFEGGDDGDDGPDRPPPPPDPTPTACVLAEHYRMPHTDCGPLPPGAPPPTDCFWSLAIEATAITYCYTDVCESLSYECEDGAITAFSDGGRELHGRLLPGGNLYWDGGEYTPY